jgi:hypothetical protein
MKMPQKTIPKGPEKLIFEKINLEHCKTDLEEQFTVFIFCLALKKKFILRCRRRRLTMFGALSYSA